MNDVLSEELVHMVDTLVRDMTDVYHMPKSECRRRILEIIEKAKYETVTNPEKDNH